MLRARSNGASAAVGLCARMRYEAAYTTSRVRQGAGRQDEGLEPRRRAARQRYSSVQAAKRADQGSHAVAVRVGRGARARERGKVADAAVGPGTARKCNEGRSTHQRFVPSGSAVMSSRPVFHARLAAMMSGGKRVVQLELSFAFVVH
jgi:hypothetical protein